MAVTRIGRSVASGSVAPSGESTSLPIRAVLFDFGHTLVDFRRTEEALLEAYGQIRARIEAVAYMEVPEILDLIERVAGGVDALVGRSYEERRMEELDVTEMFRETLAGIGFDLPQDVVAHIAALDHSAWSNSLVVREDVLECLNELKGMGYRMGLVSNVSLFPDLMHADLQRLGLDRFLDGAVFSSEIGVRKPDARIFEEALARVSATPGGTVFVGDRLLDDISGARALGMRTVHTVQFRREDDPDIPPDARIGDLSELPLVLKRWGEPPGAA
jgi:HAD superfamily hydrolase (TIGR01662 family)